MKLCLTFYYLAFICSQLTYRSLFGLMHWEHLSRSGEDGERNRVCRRLMPGAAARGRQWKNSCPVDNGAELLWISLLRSWQEVPEEWMDINEASKPWGWPCICSTKAERLGICLQPELPPIRVILVYFRNECQGRAHKISIFLWEAMGGSEPTHKVGQTPRKPPRYLPNQLHWTAYQPRAGWRQHAWWHCEHSEDPIRRNIYFHRVFDLRERKKLCKHYLCLSYPCEIFTYMSLTLLTFFVLPHTFIYLFTAIWPRWDWNIKSIYICFLLKTFTYHPPCTKSSESVPMYNLFPFSCHISSLKIKTIFSWNVRFSWLQLTFFLFGWFSKQQTGYSKTYPDVEHGLFWLEPNDS